MRVTLPDKSNEVVDAEGATVGQVLLGLGIRPNEVLVTCNGKLLPEDSLVGGDAELKIIRVSHGG
ncbi:MAG: MoaD/ThiS family protein [Methanoregula sp.]|nr:MoaD/ThiS family protein [Methanoregula sp.]